MKHVLRTCLILAMLVVQVSSLGAQVSFAWGRDALGQVTNTPTSFVQVSGGGFYHSLALKSDGSIVSWGADNWGQVSGGTVSGASLIACYPTPPSPRSGNELRAL